MNPQKALRLSLLSLGLAIPAAASFAQDTTNQPPPPMPTAPDTSPGEGAQPPPRHRGGFVLEDLTQKLNLTADQQKSVGDAIKTSRDQMKAIRSDDSLSDDDKRAKNRELMATTRAQIRALLTPDQQAIFDKLPMRGQRPPPPPADGTAPANPPPADAPPASPPPAGAPPSN